MTDPLSRHRRFLRELKRRKVYRVAAGYLVAAFVVLQLAGLAADAFGFPGWFEPMIWVLSGLGFPIALVLAWAFEVTPEGVRRTEEAEPAEEISGDTDVGLRTGYKVLVGLGLVAAAVAGGWYLTGGGGENPEISDRSVAVLPFEALGQGEPGTFTEGMHSDLQAKLSNVAGLTVSSSRAVERYRGSDVNTTAVARELGVGWVVSGDVQEMGDQIQVNVRLVDPDTETQAWTDTYRRDLTAENLFAIQSDITREVARALEAELSPEETERVETQPTGDLDAYRLYVKGRDRLNNRTEAGMRDAVDYFRRAIARDSSYALAWAGLADAGLLYPVYSSEALPASVPRPEVAAQRAVQLAPELAEAQASLGFVHYRNQAGPAAIKKLQRAVDLKPSYDQAHAWLGWIYLILGRRKDAQAHTSLAVELNPNNAAAREARIVDLIARDQLAEAQRHLDALPEEHPRSDKYQADVYYHAEEWTKLRNLARDRLMDIPAPLQEEMNVPVGHFYLARVAVRNSDTATALQHLAEVEKTESDEGLDYFGYHLKGLIQATLGEPEATVASWRQMETWTGPFSLTRRYFYPDILDSVRETLQYHELLRKINVAWGLNPDGSLPDRVDVSFDSASR